MERIDKNPWLGLQSYREGEILYGRDTDIRDLSQCVLNDKDTLLYGKSGIGKSSILNAGILPAARRHGFLPVLIRLSHKDDQPYLYQINQAIANAILNPDRKDPYDIVLYTSEETNNVIKEVLPSRDPQNESFYEYFHRHTFHNLQGDRIKLLIIFDQFEEIFTLQSELQKRKTFFRNLADVLNDIMPDELQSGVEVISDSQAEAHLTDSEDFDGLFAFNNSLPEYVGDNDIHFVFTIREDFLSEFEFYTLSIPSLKQNRYGLRPINEEQAAQIILRPVPGLISVEVAKLIIEKITGKNNFSFDGKPEIEVDSALLSLYLSRLFEAKEGEIITKHLVEQKGSQIISDFYIESIKDVSESTVEYLEDKLLNSQGRRDNITIADALNDGHVTENELDLLCNKKKILRKFNHSGDLRIEYVHDILCSVIAKNKEERDENYKKKCQDIKLKELKKQRTTTLMTILLLILGILIYLIGFHIPVQHRYASTTKRWGCFYGVEPLTKKEASYRNAHVVLKKNGLFTKTYSSLECRDRFNNISTNYQLLPYIVCGNLEDSLIADGIKGKLQMACKWEFIKDPVNKNRVIQERAYDKDDNFIFAFNYNTPQKPQNAKEYVGNQTIGSYVDEQGLPLQILKDGYRFLRITYDAKGYDMLVEYFDWDGNPATNTDGAYQAYYEYNDLGLRTSMSSLNIYGKRMIDKAGNCGMHYQYDGFRQVQITSVDEFGRVKAVDEGYAYAFYEYDEHGRPTKMTLLDEERKPVFSERLDMHIQKVVYDDASNSERQIFYDENNEQISIIEVAYDKNGNLAYVKQESGKGVIPDNVYERKSRFNSDNDLVFQNEIHVQGIDTIGFYTYVKDKSEATKTYKGRMYYEYINKEFYDKKDRIIEDVYYQLDGVNPYEGEGIKYNKTTYVYSDNGESEESLYLQEKDSIVYYTTDQIAKIKVIERAPNRNFYVERIIENKDTIITSSFKDLYGNTIEEYRGSSKFVYFINAKINERNDYAIGVLSRYKFPLSDFKYYYNHPETDWKGTICDENGRTEVDSDYTLPEVYSGDFEDYAVFIEYTENGRMWHGVILSSDRGVNYGDDDYYYSSFRGYHKIKCLNLTSMRVVELEPNNLDFWTIYGRYIPKAQSEIFKYHYLQNCVENDNAEVDE